MKIFTLSSREFNQQVSNAKKRQRKARSTLPIAANPPTFY